ncbi:MAG: 23S rRNA (adenine(2503)-C(2))-methyltransferase RlmN [Planctomycetota bacterium]|nr:23S rRNA (adenine(2503)-C(2))-methyltransferase RlmN [Planctomycetota bacterium]
MLAYSDFDVAGLEAFLRERGAKPSHAMKLLRAFYGGFGQIEMAGLDLGKVLTGELSRQFQSMQTRVIKEHVSTDGTVKLLVQTSSGETIESVFMPAFRADRSAGCISSQIGCAMGCDFCASTQGGLWRNLSSGEIVEQFLHLQAKAWATGRRISSLVFMGMGEPMNNLENVIAAINRIADPRMGNLGWRHITVSTVGVVPGIDALADANLGVCLALSLHAPDDATRSRIVPSNRRWNVAAVLDAAKRFEAKTGRVVNIEYCLLAGVNDSEEQARLLAGLLEGFAAHVNLIPYNSIGSSLSGVEYRAPGAQRLERFTSILREARVVVHPRIARGDDVAAACGQLRQRTNVIAS